MPSHVKNSKTFCGEAGRDLFQVETSARTTDINVNGMGKKAAPTKKFVQVVVRQITALKVVCGANKDRPWDAARDIEENRCGLNTQQTMGVNSAIRIFNFLTALPQRGSRIKPLAEAKSK